MPLLLLSFSCSPDLHEAVGPRVPVPNVTGTVVRVDAPVRGIRVQVEDTKGETVSETRTDAYGRYGLAEIGQGLWTIRIDSDDPSDFARATYEFEFFADDSSLTVPELNLSQAELTIAAPEDGDTVALPSFFMPQNFTWAGPPRKRQVRVFESSDEGGAAIWYSAKTEAESIRWNGLGTEGKFTGVPTPAGSYRWRLRVDGDGSIRYLTHYRQLTFLP